MVHNKKKKKKTVLKRKESHVLLLLCIRGKVLLFETVIYQN